MQYTAHHAIAVRLNKWIEAFNADAWPAEWDMESSAGDHVGSAYDFEVLAELALQSGQSN